jgi:hypothetical protein
MMGLAAHTENTWTLSKTRTIRNVVSFNVSILAPTIIHIDSYIQCVPTCDSLYAKINHSSLPAYLETDLLTPSTIQRLGAALNCNQLRNKPSSFVSIKYRVAYNACEETPSNHRMSGHTCRNTPKAREVSRDADGGKWSSYRI